MENTCLELLRPINQGNHLTKSIQKLIGYLKNFEIRDSGWSITQLFYPQYLRTTCLLYSNHFTT